MSDALRQAISRRVLVARNQAQLTQEQLAEVIERSVEAVSNIERGLSLPTVDTIERIARAVCVPLHLFFQAESGPDGDNRDAVLELGIIVAKLNSRDAGLLVKLAKSMSEGWD